MLSYLEKTVKLGMSYVSRQMARSESAQIDFYLVILIVKHKIGEFIKSMQPISIFQLLKVTA